MASDVLVVEPGTVPVGETAGGILSAADEAALRAAVRVLEHSTLVGRLSGMAGRPLELLGRSLPAPATEMVRQATDAALRGALKVALTSLSGNGGRFSALFPTRLAAAASGALGGALGFATLPVELPISTVLMLRAVAEIAAAEGEDLADPEVGLACLQVFALGGKAPGGGDTEDVSGSGYFAVRSALAKSVSEAARLVAGRQFADKSAPAIARFIAGVASRFGIVVSQKVAAGAIPVLGAIGGATVNTAFVEHFRALGRGHFTVRRLERAYGREPVRVAYEAIRAELA